MVWYPRGLPGEPADTSVELLTAACQYVQQGGVAMAQCMLRTVPADEQAVLRQVGFYWLANLFYLVSADQDFPAALPESPLSFEPLGPANEARLTEIIQTTYRQTLDCPRLSGLRDGRRVGGLSRHGEP